MPPAGGPDVPRRMASYITTRRGTRAGKARPRSGRSAGRGEVQQAAVGVEGEAVAAEDGVAEDAVDARPGIVLHHRDVAQLDAADAERGEPARRAPAEPGQRLQGHDLTGSR